MSEKEPRIYVGSGKKSDKYDMVNISVCLTDLPREHIFEYNNKKYIKLTVAAKKEVDKWGKTHSVSIDTYKPEKKESAGADIEKAIPPPEDEDPLPF